MIVKLERLLPVLLALALTAALLLSIACADDDDDDQADDDTGDDDTGDDDADDDDDDDDLVVGPADNEPPFWPEWVLEHWVWEDEGDRGSAEQLVADYLAHEIPVGALIIDSPWETGYNSFVPDPEDYPDAGAMIDGLHELDVRVLFWITGNVNLDSPNYDEACDNGYLLSDCRTVDWWKGEGSFIDLTNPDAVDWWHSQIDQMLDLGIDGWKCDGTGPYMYLWVYATGYGGTIFPWEWMEMYYADFFDYTRERLGPDRVTLARPFDSYGLPLGLEFAPRDKLASGWVGDQDPTWSGLQAAMFNIFESGRRAFVNVGSDIGGYREDELRDKELFIRWAQFGALCPIMENGGGGEHRPWIYDEQVLSIYRDYVNLHLTLKPYLYSMGAEAFVREVGLMRQLEGEIDLGRYMLGDNLLVAAIYQAGASREIEFPEGVWIDWFDGSEHSGPSVETIDYSLERYPIFVRKGSIIPLELGEDSIVQGDAGTPPALTVRIDPLVAQNFELYEEGRNGATISYELADALQIEISANDRAYALLVRGQSKPATVSCEPHGVLDECASIDALSAVERGWWFDATTAELWIKPGAAQRGLRVSVQ
ncbi:MAG: glycoside hydrolase family 31 protein [Candidatus Alcyoniella australis]|nr:glycoside hydrolase family 31 protein [Candidatus Alcyoniella australis]